MRIAISGCVAAFLLSLCVTAAAETSYNMTLSGASPGGLWSMLGVATDRAVKASYPESQITYQTSGGGLANIMLLEKGGVELGLVHDAELKLAKKGEKPFTSPIDSARILAVLYNWAPMQMIMAKSFADEYGIKTFEDIAVKKPPLRVALNKRGNITEYVAVKMFNAIGVTLDDIESWGGKVVYAGSGEQGDFIKDHRIDMLANGVFVRSSFILQAADAVELVLLPVSEEVVKKVGEEVGVSSFVIPADSYSWQPQALTTLGLSACLVTSSQMSDQDAYNLTKALVENIGEVKGVHNAMKALTPQLMASYKGDTPYHKGSVLYYKEVGLMQ